MSCNYLNIFNLTQAYVHVYVCLSVFQNSSSVTHVCCACPLKPCVNLFGWV